MILACHSTKIPAAAWIDLHPGALYASKRGRSCISERSLSYIVVRWILLQNYVRHNQWPFWLSWGLSLVAIIALGCSRTLRYKVPYNYLFLVRCFLADCIAATLLGWQEYDRGGRSQDVSHGNSGSCLHLKTCKLLSVNLHAP
jgi:hypothetical protein